MSLLKIEKDRLTIDGEEFYLASGDIQYYRIHPTEWKPRLEKMKDFGLTAIQTYCPWNLHEPSEGVFDFSGLLDLGAFLKTCDEVGLKVLLRPSPFICAEWEGGGLPWWLLKDRHMRVRSSYGPFLEKLENYHREICKQFVPYLSTNGGPVIMVCIENEYGAVRGDLEYIKFIMDSLKRHGVDVPLYQTDNHPVGVAHTMKTGLWTAYNYRIESDTAVPLLKKLQPDLPAFVGEYWSGRSVYWGEDGSGRDVEPIAKMYKVALDEGAYLNFYMFGGGTNFGFMNGSRIVKPFNGKGEKIFRAITTSYNCDALLNEEGRATPKYYACREVLDAHYGKELRKPDIADPETQTATCTLTETAPVFDNLDKLGENVKCPEPLSFEELDCPYGYVLYTVEIPDINPDAISKAKNGELEITVNNVHDRALVFIDGKRMGEVIRDREHPVIKVNVTDKAHRLDILVENLGRTNTVPEFFGEKGIRGKVKLGSMRLYGFDHRPFKLLSPVNGNPFNVDLSGLEFSDKKSDMPRFLRGKFNAKGGISTNLSLEGLGSGAAFINGFNIGRYLDVGPQRTLYIPGALLKDGENELVLLELSDKDVSSVNFVNDAIYDGEYKEM